MTQIEFAVSQATSYFYLFFSHEPHTQNLLISNLLTYVYDSYIFSMKFIFSKSSDPLF